MALFVGVDIGTQGTKTAVYSEDGRLIADAFEPSKLVRPSADRVEEDPERQVGSVCRTIANTIEKIETGPASSGYTRADIAAVAIDGQMAGVIGIGKDGTAVTPYDSWLDARCATEIDRMRETAEAEVLAKTGCAPSLNHGPKMLWWQHEHPEIFSRIVAFVQPAGYAVSRLCDLGAENAFLDYTYLHFSGFADTQRGRWDHGLCAALGMPLDKLPRIVASHEIVGKVGGAGSRESGVPAGTPVVAGCGDTAASFLAGGATQPGVCVDVAGTASVFAATTTEYRPDCNARVLACSRSAVPGLWHPYAYINGGGMNLEWFEREFAGDVDVGKSTLDQEALEVPLSDDLPLFVPHLGGRVSPSMPRLRGAWVGLTWSHGRAELYRAILEGVALEYGLYRDSLLNLYPDLELREVRVTGGGQQSVVWNRMKASVLDATVKRIQGGGGAPMGSAMLAAYGIGLRESLEGIAHEWVQLVPGAEPVPAQTATYRHRISRYRKLIDLLNTYHEEDQA